MRAMVLHDWVERWGDNLKLEIRPIPKLGPKDVLVKVKACGVGLTVSNFMMGGMGKDPKLLPRIPGDETAGEVAEVGSQVEGFRVGDRVLVYLFITCGKCEYCLSGRNNLCANFRGWIGRHYDGGYAEFVKVPESNLFKLPEEIKFIDATIINTALSSSVHVLDSRARMSFADNIMVMGAAGGVGVHLVQLAKLYGGNVFAVDVDEEKLHRLKEYGTDFILNPKKVDLPEEINKLTNGRGVNIVVELVGTPETLTNSMKCLGKEGRLVNLTSHPGVKLEAPLISLVLNEITVTGSRYTTKQEFLKAVEFLREGKIKPVISVVRKLEEVEKIHVSLAEHKLFGRGAITP